MKRKSLYNLCINDIILTAVIVIITAVLSVTFLIVKGSDEGNTVRVTIAGNEYGTYSLSENREIDITDEYGTNTVSIKDGKVTMENADCPDKYCVLSGSISKSGETIVCLPHKLVVEIRCTDSGSEQEIDAIVQ